MTAAVFALDAWFGVLTAVAGADWYESLAAAWLGEIPVTVLLAVFAVWAPRYFSAADQVEPGLFG